MHEAPALRTGPTTVIEDIQILFPADQRLDAGDGSVLMQLPEGSFRDTAIRLSQ
ncbi:MAG TPA: hypothetical protein VJN96_05765 [Vicinamibacterales bacterium]|nr:hypothetical protein [Vicinamibacterales bacterium]